MLDAVIDTLKLHAAILKSIYPYVHENGFCQQDSLQVLKFEKNGYAHVKNSKTDTNIIKSALSLLDSPRRIRRRFQQRLFRTLLWWNLSR